VWRDDWRDPEQRLADVHGALRPTGLAVHSAGPFEGWDLEVRGGTFGAARVLFAAEDHGAGTQYLRFRITPRLSRLAVLVCAMLLVLAVGAGWQGSWIVATVLAAASILLLGSAIHECGSPVSAARRAADGELSRAGRRAADGAHAPAAQRLDAELTRLATGVEQGP